MKKSLIFSLIIIIGVSFLFLANKEEVSLMQGNQRVIEVNAFRFGYDPEVIYLNKGEEVEIKINNLDVFHGISVPGFNVKGNEVIKFTADKIGEFEWYCNNFCGGGHRSMRGKIIVE